MSLLVNFEHPIQPLQIKLLQQKTNVMFNKSIK